MTCAVLTISLEAGGEVEIRCGASAEALLKALGDAIRDHGPGYVVGYRYEYGEVGDGE